MHNTVEEFIATSLLVDSYKRYLVSPLPEVLHNRQVTTSHDLMTHAS
jgi:hypothetical protein